MINAFSNFSRALRALPANPGKREPVAWASFSWQRFSP